MTENKCTPGPWNAALDHNNRPIVWGPGTWQIADCWHTPDGNGWANARLIASAPDLLEALRPFAALDLRPDGFDRRDDSHPVYARDNSVITVGDVRRAVAAIAKATGGEL